MARTKKAPWDYKPGYVTLAQLQEDNQYIEYLMILNRLERDYGIDRVADIAMPWRKFETAKKLELAKQLEIELDTAECTCKPDLPDGRCFPLCPVCKAQIDAHYGDEIPIGG